MPEKQTVQRARRQKRRGRSPSTQAGEFVREEMHHVREGKHGARNPKQAIAIGLSKARRAGVNVGPGKTASKQTQERAQREKRSASRKRAPSPARSRAVRGALRREGSSAASSGALARQARSSARRRGATNRSAAARKAARTKGASGRSQTARKAARTRARRAAG